MSNIDSVINGLDEIMRYNGEQMFYNDIFIRGIAEDAIAMLKKQKPVKPNRLLNEKVVSYKNVVYQYSCNNCSTLLRKSWKACPLCGQAVKWE